MFERGEVRLQNQREKSGADGSVRGRIHPSDWAGESVDGPESGIGQGESSAEGGVGKIYSGAGVAEVARQRFEGLGGEREGGLAERVRERIGSA